MGRPEPVLIPMSILAGLQILFAGGAITTVLPAQWAAFGALVVAACQVGVAFYVRGTVTPVDDPVTVDERTGTLVSLVPSTTACCDPHPET